MAATVSHCGAFKVSLQFIRSKEHEVAQQSRVAVGEGGLPHYGRCGMENAFSRGEQPIG